MRLYIKITEQDKVDMENIKSVPDKVILGDPALADKDFNPIKHDFQNGGIIGIPVYYVYDDVNLTTSDIDNIAKDVVVTKNIVEVDNA